MKKKMSSDSSTEVVRMGMSYFTTSESCSSHLIVGSEMAPSSSEQTPEVKKKHKDSESKKEPGRLYKFVKKHFLSRKNGPTNVKEIHIVPEGDELKWARRSAHSAASRSSEETTTSEEDTLEVVHDMAEEYIPDSL